MILVLIGAAVVTALIGHTKDTFIILAIVVFNGIVGFVQEYRAGQAMEALKRMASPEARVMRGGTTRWYRLARSCPATSCCSSKATSSRPTCVSLEAPALRIDEAAADR